MIKPSKSHQKVIYFSLVCLWVSGIVFLVDRFLLGNLFELFAARSALQVNSMKIHGALSIIFIFIFGTIFSHFQRAWPLKKKRLSGLSLIGVLSIICLSIWPLYYSADNFNRIISISIHSILGTLLPLFIIFHVFSKDR